MHRDLLILTSPPASGKTYWISAFHKALDEKSILVISPLRALANECKAKWPDTISVMTPEEWGMKKKYCDVVLIDEFHLFFYWGDSFRFKMWEVFYEIALHSKLMILLTATLSDEMREETVLFSSHFDSILWINHGNQILKYCPELYIKAPSKRWLINQIKTEDLKNGVKLIFCQYRKEVFQLEEELKKLGYECLTCVGGESKFMGEKLMKNSSPDFIISTTVLSHGVNLPVIKKVYVLYEIKNLDFWIQMIARGGRNGETYKVLGLDHPFHLKWRSWKNCLQVLFLTIKFKLSPRSLREGFFISK